MAAVTETYLAGVNATTTVDGNSMEVEDGNYTCEVSTDEMTNNKGGGFYEDVRCIGKCSGSVKAIYKGSNPPSFIEGSIYPMTIAVPSGPSVTGNFRITKMDYPIMNVKGGVKYSWDFTSQGPYVKSGG